MGGRLLLITITLIVNSEASSSFDPPILPQQPNSYKDGKALIIPLNEQGTNELYERWLSQAVSGLFAAVAQKHLDQVDEPVKQTLQHCSKDAQNVGEHAKCVAQMLHAADGKTVKDTSHAHLKHKILKKHQKSVRSNGTIIKQSKHLEWVGGFGMARAKRESGYKVVHRTTYSLTDKNDEMPMARLAKMMTKTVRKLKNKNEDESWRETVQRLKETAANEKKLEEQKDAMMKKLRGFIDNTPRHLEDPIKKEALEKLEKEAADKKMIHKKAEEMDEIRVPMKLLREAVKLGMQMSGSDMEGYDNKTLRLVSPRFFSVVKDENEEDMVNLLSPSLFSLHSDGSEKERMFSLPNLLQGLSRNDQDEWMNFIVEAAGVSDAVIKAQAARKLERESESRGPDGTPLYLTKQNATEKFGPIETKKVDTFETVYKKYSDKQKSELDKQGFSFMTEEQLDILYGKDSPYHQPDRLEKYKEFARMKDSEKHGQLKQEIISISQTPNFTVSVGSSHPSSSSPRHKRNIILSPIVNSPLIFASAAMSNTWIVLSPVVFSPVILSPASMGPVILSPWVFIPVILSPRLLSPLILNPMIFSPIILSPLCLHPLILSPGIFNPLILSPFVLSPFILSPQVFTPVILSPFALSPLILTPAVGSPLILSPFVLSPIILSPQVLFAVVLSPYALSPLVESKLTLSEVVLSPSVLS